MFKGKLNVVPEIAFITLASMVGTFVLVKALKTNAVAQLANLPIAGAVLSGLQAVHDEAYT
jgi:hypothetical protein